MLSGLETGIGIWGEIEIETEIEIEIETDLRQSMLKGREVDMAIERAIDIDDDETML